jgi:hypothetical protein
MARLHPELTRFLGSMKTEGGKDFAAEAAARVQAHLDAQQVAQAQQAAQDQFVGKMATLKSNLVNMARSDPTSHDLALDLADITMRGMTQAHGAPQEAHDALLGGMQSDIAHAAIEGLANVSGDAARKALTSGRLADLIPDEAKAGLSSYIDNMAATRNVDATARQAEVARQHIQMSNQGAQEWLSSMTHPTTGQLQFPDNWGQRMLNDPRMSPMDKAALQGAYRNLLDNGNPAQSDPAVVHDLLSRAALPHNDPDNPSVGEVLSHAGRGLTLADAQMIAGRSGPQDPLTDQSTSRIADVLDGARQQIGNQSAFGRFVNWLLPAVRSGASLDPNAKEYALTPERMATFQPTGDDIIAPATIAGWRGAQTGPHGSSMQVVRPPTGNDDVDVADYRGRNTSLGSAAPARRTLGEIFGGAVQDAMALPGAIAHGVTSTLEVANSPARQDLDAYANPLPVQGPNGPTPNPPHSPTMADMAPANPEDLTLSSGQNVGPVGGQ